MAFRFGCFAFVVILLLMLTFVSARAADEQAPEPIASSFLDRLGRSDFSQAEGMMSDELKRALPADKLRELWGSLPLQVGALLRRGESSVSRGDDATIVVVPLTFERQVLNAVIAVGEHGRITGFHLKPATDGREQKAGTVAASGLRRGQGMSGFEQRELAVGSGRQVLRGVLTLPERRDGGPVAAVVVVPGSGPLDRDGTIGAARPYADLARGLALRGVASLRFDKRSLVWPASFEGRAYTIEDEMVEDAVAAVHTMRQLKEIDPARIVVLAHSLGGLAVPRIADRAGEIAGFVLFAVPSRPILDLLVEQSGYVAALDGMSGQDRATIASLRETVATIRDGKQAGDAVLLGASVSYWQDLETVDIVAQTSTLDSPLMLLQGGRDYQVTDEDWKRWRAALGKKSSVALHHYPRLNHLGIAGSHRSSPADYLVPGEVDEQLIIDVARWIVEVIGSRSSGAAILP